MSKYYYNIPTIKNNKLLIYLGYEVPASAKKPKRSKPLARDPAGTSKSKKRKLDTSLHESEGKCLQLIILIKFLVL